MPKSSLRLADLHIHTTASDGVYTPEKVVAEAIQNNVRYIAITDHDTIEAYKNPAIQNISAKDLIIIPGIEFSINFPLHEVHILGYRINYKNKEFIHELAKLSADRLTRTAKIITKLETLGYNISLEHVLKVAGQTKAIGRPHIAKALIASGYFSSMKEVFTVLLNHNAPAYVPHYKLDLSDCLQLIRTAGGIPVLAHPGLIGDDYAVENIIHQGVLGIEVFHPSHSQGETQKYLHIAQKHKLLITGGSDFHGIPGRNPQRIGDCTIPEEYVIRLLEY